MSITQELFFGGSRHVTMTGDIVLVPQDKRVQVFAPDGAHNISLPDATTLRKGGPQFYLLNASATHNLLIRDDGGTILAVGEGLFLRDACVVLLSDNSTSNGIWHFKFFTLNGP